MRPRLLAWLRCPSCQGTLVLEQDRSLFDLATETDISEGRLTCAACAGHYPIIDGIPRFVSTEMLAPVTRRTAHRFGLLWMHADLPHPGTAPQRTYHVEQMTRHLGLGPIKGLVLDAGCGEGIDLCNQAQHPNVEIVGVELSEGGCSTSRRRAAGRANVHVVQTDICRLPLDTGQFDVVYSYGVVHHVAEPAHAMRELARVLKPSGRCIIYVYEDFSERPRILRRLLAVVNGCRHLTTRIPASWLYRLCQFLSPVVFLMCVVPYRLLRRVPRWRGVAEQLPFRHGRGPFTLTGDLYDRFSAPIERRYSRAQAGELMHQAGLEHIAVAFERGWVVTGVKPAMEEVLRHSRQASDSAA